MKLSFSYIPFRWLPTLLLCVAYALLQAVAFHPFLSFAFPLLLLKSAMDALILAGIGALLAVAIPSSDYVKLDSVQRFVNFFALGMVVALIWAALFFFSSWLVFGNTRPAEIRSLLPLATFIGVLAYVTLLQVTLRRMEAGEKGNGPELPEEENDIPAAESLRGKEQEETETLERVAVRVGQRIHVIFVPDIVYIRSDGDYVQIVTDQNRFLKEETMKYFEAGLPSSQFVRVHRSYIVNVEKILRIEMYEKQNQMLTLKNGDKIRASVSGYKALRAVLNL
ncbi:MAG: LytTR family transcriptional regulator DNA-binding domain-containing protein [Proteiniphilum sp.]|jgi:hypothetical protein|nr:LytTR family transcriptional regulator DNA-binding domain-containing protein [Proteiniphilum sp.]